MKRSFGYIICVNLVISILVGGLVNLQSVNASQALTPGDQLLYKTTNMYWSSSDYKIFAELPNPNVSSYWDYYQSDYNYTIYNSFKINSATNTSVFANHTFTEYEDYYHNYYYYQNYDYGLPGWVPAGSDDYSYKSDYCYSSHSPNYYFPANVTKGLNMDLSYYYGPSIFNFATFQYSFTYNTVINGVPQAIPVDYYLYSDMNTYDYTSNFYDLEYITEVEEYRYHNFYVDPSTGNLLYYNYAHQYFENYDWINSSVLLGMDIEKHDHYESISIFEWKLNKCTMDYSPVADADVPALIFKSFNHDINNATSVVSIPFYIEDSWPTVTADVFIDGTYYDTVFWSTSGMKNYDIPANDIPFDGPGHLHWIMFKLHDDYDININSTWETYLNDYRTKEPSWNPSWIEGPTNVTILAGDYYEYFLIFSDTNWTVEFYKYNGTDYNYYDWWTGYQNDSVSLWDYDLTVGTYFYWIHFYDNVGTVQDIYLSVTVNPSDAPQISGPDGEYWYEVGTDDIIYWQLFDNDPYQFEVLLDSTTIYGPTSYSDGFMIGVDLQSFILSSGDYILTIKANDTTGYTSIINLLIHAQDTWNPYIEGPDYTTYIEEGEDKKLVVKIQDLNPYNYSVFMNYTEIEYGLWYEEYYEIEIDLSNLTVGYYQFIVVAYDTSGNCNDYYFEVIVEEATNPTDPDDPDDPDDHNNNTITLDAPGFLYAIIGVLSVVAITILFRKRR